MQQLHELINKLISEFPHVMIENRNGHVYHLQEHHKHLDWKRDSKRVLLGKGVIGDVPFVYLTEKLRVRTKH